MPTRHSDGRFLSALKLLNVVIGVACALALALLVRQGLSIVIEEPMTRLLPQKATSRTPAPSFSEYEVIMKNNPFGPSAGQLQLVSASAPASTRGADIRLIGTISGGSRHNYAFFSATGDRQEVLREGQTLPGIGTLKRVERDKAVLHRDDGPIEVPLTEISVAEGGTQPRNPETKATGRDFVRTLGKGQFILDQKTVLNALEKPNQLMTDARLQPNIVDGRQEGFVLREVRNGGIYQSLGLMNGDVLLRINNYSISNPDNALQAFTALRGMDRVDLDIVRSGSRMTLTYLIQ
jgi:general secretion pathway protein C